MCVATQRPEGLRHVEAFGLALADRRDEALDRAAVQRNLSLDLRPVRFAGRGGADRGRRHDIGQRIRTEGLGSQRVNYGAGIVATKWR